MVSIGIEAVGLPIPKQSAFFNGNTDFSIESAFPYIFLHEDFLWYRKTSKNKQRN